MRPWPPAKAEALSPSNRVLARFRKQRRKPASMMSGERTDESVYRSYPSFTPRDDIDAQMEIDLSRRG